MIDDERLNSTIGSNFKLVYYIFLDIVDFTKNRSIQSQQVIINVLNNIIKNAVKENNIEDNSVIFIPTGDGVCIAILDMVSAIDIHIKIALEILKNIEIHNTSQIEDELKFKVRIGVNELKVAQEDIGKVIGKQGRTAKAMRSILSAAAKKQKKECYLKILE